MHTPTPQAGEPRSPELTAIVVERGEVGLLLCTTCAVAHSHLQLIPRGFLQVIQDVGLGEGGPLGCGPDRGPKGSVLKSEGGDGAATVIPANQIQPHSGGIDAGEELLLLGELGFCGRCRQCHCGHEGVYSGFCVFLGLLALCSLALAKAGSLRAGQSRGNQQVSQP